MRSAAGAGYHALPLARSPERHHGPDRTARRGRRRAVVAWRNARDVVDRKAAPVLGEPIALDLGARGIRSIEYSSRHACYFILGGAHASVRITELFRWDGSPDSRPVSLRKFGDLNPEAVVPVPGSPALRIFSDDGTVLHRAKPEESTEKLENGFCECKTLVDPRRKTFRSLSIEVD